MNKEINVKLSFRDEEQARSFERMLAWMDWCGKVGHSSKFEVFIDGDGRGQIDVEFTDPELQKVYIEERHKMEQVSRSGIERKGLRFNIE